MITECIIASTARPFKCDCVFVFLVYLDLFVYDYLGDCVLYDFEVLGQLLEEESDEIHTACESIPYFLFYFDDGGVLLLF